MQLGNTSIHYGEDLNETGQLMKDVLYSQQGEDRDLMPAGDKICTPRVTHATPLNRLKISY